MKSRFRKLAVESLDGRRMLSATAFADFNHDGLVDMAAITGQKTITVSLAKPDGSYTISATLTAPKPITEVVVTNVDSDGIPDLQAIGSKSSDDFFWKGNGDGTFEYLQPWKPRHSHGFF